MPNNFQDNLTEIDKLFGIKTPTTETPQTFEQPPKEPKVSRFDTKTRDMLLDEAFAGMESLAAQRGKNKDASDEPVVREGYLESTIMPWALDAYSKFFGGASAKEQGYKRYEERSPLDLIYEKDLDPIKLRQTKLSDRGMRDLLTAHFKDTLQLPAEEIAQVIKNTGFDIDNEDSAPERVFHTLQRAADAVLTSYVVTGAMRRLNEKELQMPSTFKYTPETESIIKAAVEQAKKTGAPVDLGPQHGLQVPIMVTPDMDAEDVREISWNAAVIYARNVTSQQMQHGKMEDVATVASFFIPGANVASALKLAGGVAKTTVVGAKTAANAARIGNNLLARVPARLQGVVTTALKTVDNAASIGAMSAFSNPGQEKQAGVAGAVVAGAFGGLLGGISVLPSILRPVNVATRITGDVAQNQARAATNAVNQRIQSLAGDADLKGMDFRAFDHTIRKAIDDPYVNKQVQELHELINPETTIHGSRHREVLEQATNSLQERRKYLEGQSNIRRLDASEQRELTDLIDSFNAMQKGRNQLFASTELPTGEFLQHIKTHARWLHNPVQRYLEQVEHSENSYLTRFMVQVLTNPFRDSGARTQRYLGTDVGRWSQYATHTLGLQSTDPLYKSLEKLADSPEFAQLRQAGEQYANDLADMRAYSNAVVKELQDQGATPSEIRAFEISAMEGKPLIQQGRTVTTSHLDVIRDAANAIKGTGKNQQGSEATARQRLSAVEASVGKEREVNKLGLTAYLSVPQQELHAAVGVAQSIARFQQNYGPQLQLLRDLPDMLAVGDYSWYRPRQVARLFTLASELETLIGASGGPNMNLGLQFVRENANLIATHAKAMYVYGVRWETDFLQTASVGNLQNRAVRLRALSADATTVLQKSRADQELAAIRPRLVQEIQTNLGIDATSADFVVTWKYGSSDDLIQQVAQGGDLEHLVTLQLDNLDRTYSMLGNMTLDRIVNNLNQNGLVANKPFLQGWFLRVSDPDALMQVFAMETPAYQRTLLASGALSKQGREASMGTASWIAQTQTLENVMEVSTMQSMAAMLGRYQLDARMAMNSVGSFFNHNEVRALHRHAESLITQNPHIDATSKLWDGVEGFRTLLVGAEALKQGGFDSVSALNAVSLTPTGRLVEGILTPQLWGDVAASAQKITDDLMANPAELSSLLRHMRREKSDFGLMYSSLKKRLGKNIDATSISRLDQVVLRREVDNFSKEFVDWAHRYFSQTPATVEEILAGLESYKYLRAVDVLTSATVSNDLSRQKARYGGLTLNPHPHRTLRVFGATLEEVNMSKALTLTVSDVSGIGRYFGSTESSQIAKAQSRNLSSTDSLINTFTRNSLVRIQQANIAHMETLLRDKTSRFMSLGFVEQGKAIQEFLDYNLNNQTLDNLPNEIYKLLFRMKGIGKTAQVAHTVSESLFSYAAILGRSIKPLKEGMQLMYLATASTSLFSSTAGLKAYAKMLVAPPVNFLKSLGIISKGIFRMGDANTVGMPDPLASKLYGARKVSGNPIDARMVELGNELTQYYRDSGKFAEARRAGTRSMAGGNTVNWNKTPFRSSVRNTLDSITRAGQHIYDVTKEAQETLSVQTALSAGESIFRAITREYIEGSPTPDLAKRTAKMFEASTSEYRLFQILDELFEGVPHTQEGIFARLRDPAGSQLYTGLMSLMVDTFVGRYGGAAGSRISRTMARIVPALGMYSVPKSLFLDRFLIRPFLSTAASSGSYSRRTGTILAPMLMPYFTYLGISKLFEVLERGTEGSDSWLTPDSFDGAIVDYFEALTEHDPLLQKFVTKGTGIPFTGAEIAPKWLSGGKLNQQAFGEFSNELTATSGFERGASNVVGLNPYSMLQSIMDTKNMATLLKVRHRLNSYADMEFETKEQYDSFVKDTYSQLMGVLPERSSAAIRKKVEAGQSITNEELDEIEQELFVEFMEKAEGILYRTPLAAIVYTLNPTVLMNTYKEFYVKKDLEGSENWDLFNKAIGLPPGADHMKFAGRMLGIWRDSGVISEDTMKKIMEDYEEVWTLSSDSLPPGLPVGGPSLGK